MKRLLLLMVGILFVAFSTQATAGIITFEGIVGPGERLFANTGERPSPQIISDGIDNYIFTLNSGNWSFEDSAYPSSPNPPQNGTDTMSVDGYQFSSITIQKQGGGSFDLDSIDMASWSGTGTTVRATSGVLSQDFSPGFALTAFSFSNAWSGLSSVSFTNINVPNAWTLDNVVLNSTVPEPTTMLMLGLGLMGLAGVRRRMHK
jgi:hypothetical protein